MEQHNTTFDPMAWTASESTAPKSHTPAHTVNELSAQCRSPSDELALAMAVTRELINRGANIAEDYRDYVRLGFALASGLGNQGRDLYHMLCAHSRKYRMQDCERKWQECLARSDGRTTIATFYHMARQAGVDLSLVARNMNHKHIF